MVTLRVPFQEEMNAVYDRYAKSLEADHLGEYIAVSPHGEVTVGPDLFGVTPRARNRFGAGNYLFRLGTRTVVRWRWCSE